MDYLNRANWFKDLHVAENRTDDDRIEKNVQENRMQ